MSYCEVIAFNLISIGFSIWIPFCVFFYLVRRKLSLDKRGILKAVIVGILLDLMVSVLAAFFYKTGFFREPVKRFAAEFITWYITVWCIGILLCIIFHERWKRCWIFGFFLRIIEECSSNLVFILDTKNGAYDLTIFSEFLGYSMLVLLVTPLVELFILYALEKIGVLRMFWDWLRQEEFQTGAIVIISSFPVWKHMILAVLHARSYEGFDEMAVTVLLVLLFLVIFSYMMYSEVQKKQLEAQQISLAQQKNYIESLEGLQREMRMFRHDYKNMMSGMYLQAKEGDVWAIQQFIQNMTDDFDSQVGSQIQLLTQLANVHMLEVKGLLLEKLDEMQREKIECGLEVHKPFYATQIRSTDLCRCLGILIDNAIDEVRGIQKAKIEIMISSREEYTTFLVKNPLFTEIDFHKIWQEGYSTKGRDRGVGLASYQKILERYDRVLPITTVKDGYFIQELKILEQ